MAARMFPVDNIVLSDGQRRSAMRIECCKCGGVDHCNNSGPKRLPPEAAEQYFRNRGWSLGNGPARDVCPACQQDQRKTKKEKVAAPMSTAKTEIATVKAEEPRKMDRDYKIVIINSIQDHHDGDRYNAGWSDKKLAEDLGVPWAWVKDVRENVLEFSGGHDGALDEFLREAKPVLDEARALLADVAKQQATAKSLADRLSRIEVLAKKIEAEIGR